jgi:hypothetical protein
MKDYLKQYVDEKRVFYLNLLVDSEKIFEQIIFLYETYLEENNIDEFEMIEFLKRMDLKKMLKLL